MKKLSRFVSGKLFLLIVLLVAATGIWFFGDKFRLSGYAPFSNPVLRWWTAIALLIMAGLLALVMVFAFLRRRRAHHQAAAKREPTPEEIACAKFDQSFDIATSVIRDKWQGAGDYIYGAPWYLVLGYSGAGKSSIVDNAGMRFPIEHSLDAALKTIGGRGADAVTWRVANEAVILDIDGNLLNDDDPVNSVLWSRLLRRLRRQRSRLPLNGVALVVDFAEFIGMNADERAALASTIRAKMQELVERLGIQPTVYLIFTKLDLIAGFMEFFENLTPTEREKLFGLHFDRSATSSGEWFAQFEKDYQTLIARMHEKALLRVRDLRDSRSRQEAYLFVQQMAGLYNGLRAFLEDALGPDRYSSPPLLRGVYFTSVRQENAPKSIFMDAIAHRYQVSQPTFPAHGGVSRAYFSTGLLSRAMFPEAGITGPNRRIETRRNRMVAATAAFWVLLCVGGALYWRARYVENIDRAEAVLAKSAAFVDAKGGLNAPEATLLLEPLNAIREATFEFGDYTHVSGLVATAALYQGKVVGPIADEAYTTTLRTVFGPALGASLEEEMRTVCPKGGEAELELLSVYLMLGSPENRDDDAIIGYFTQDWQRRLTGQAQKQRELRAHLEHLLKRSSFVLDVDQALIQSARRNLQNTQVYERLYRGLQLDAARQMPNPVDIRTAVGPNFNVIYEGTEESASPDRLAGAQTAATEQGGSECADSQTETLQAKSFEVERFFTRRQFFDYFIAQSRDLSNNANEDLWVLGQLDSTEYSSEDIARTSDELRKLYADRYITAWRQAINHLKVQRFQSLSDAAIVLDVLSGADRPMQRIVDLIRDNTIIYEPAAPGAEATLNADDGYRETGIAIQRAFASIQRLSQDQGSEAEPNLEEIRTALFALFKYVRDIRDAPPDSKAALTRAVERINLRGDDPIYVLKRIANGTPPPFNQHLRDIADNTWAVIMKQALIDLEKEWRDNIYGQFWQSIGSRYPFNPKSPDDVPIEDFIAFFRPGGVLDRFFIDELGPFINLDTGEPREHDGQALRIAPDFVRNMRSSLAITRNFFQATGGLMIEYDVTPLTMSNELAGATLSVEGQIIQYDSGPSRPRTIVWPNAVQAVGASRVTLAPRARGRAAVFDRRGPWSWLRIYDDASKANFTNNTVETSYADAQGRSVTYRLRVRNSVNPFFNSPLRGLSLPSRLSADEE